MKQSYIYKASKQINHIFLALYVCVIFTSCDNIFQLSVSSPNVALTLKADVDSSRVFYSLSRNGKPVLNKSALGFILAGGSLKENLEIYKVTHSSYNKTWNQVCGEEKIVKNNYNEMKIRVQEKTELKRKFDVVFRVFNDGIGFRYEFPKQKNLKDFVIMDELTEFALTGNHTSWSIPYESFFYEALYKSAPVDSIGWVCTPLTMETKDGLYLSIHEANLTDYAAMNLIPKNRSNTLKANLTPWSTGEKVFMKAPGVTPWRTMIVAENPGDLLLSRIMLNLNEPNKIKNTSWIHPGRYIGIWWAYHMKKYTWQSGPLHGATTENAKRYIDFAAKYGFSGVLVEGWNKGWDTYKFNFTEPYPDFDIKRITEYADSKNVMLIGHHETDGKVSDYESQITGAFDLYKKYGVHAVKTGYVGKFLDGKERHSSQYGVRHFRKVIELAAKYHIMIDNHEPVMPTGIQRTWPNLMTQEGVRGQEWDAWDVGGGNPPEHTTIIPFTRGLAGPMDFTPGTFNFVNTAIPTTRVQTTLAKQLALFVILYSPLQMASDEIENYEKNPVPFEFITSCPTNWEKTVVPEAKIGEYVTIARKDRKSDNWFIGSITNASPRFMNFRLSFLDKGCAYTAKIFKDGYQANYIDNPYPVDVEEMNVTDETVLNIEQAPGGGTAIIITKQN
jgi:alpha-glucosidase